MEAIRVANQQEERLCIGPVQVWPALREIRGSAGSTMLEPRVLQVLLALAQEPGKVIGREALLAHCWPGMVVSDDSLNRAIASLRKALRAAGGGLGVETIPKSGYRLSVETEGDPPQAATPPPGPPAPGPGSPLLRRRVVGAGLASVAVCGAGAAAWWWPDRAQGRADGLVAQAEEGLRENPTETEEPTKRLKEAIRLQPGHARAWGLYALALRNFALNAAGRNEPAAIAEAQTAAREALARDARQPDALVALATSEPDFTHWHPIERQLAAVQREHPTHWSVLMALANLHAKTGRARDNQQLSRQLAQATPWSPHLAARLVWATHLCGDLAATDRLAIEALQHWPDHPLVWQMRMATLGFSGRAEQALAMIEERGGSGSHPPLIGDALVATLRVLAGWGSADEAVAIALSASRLRQSSAMYAIALLASLGALDPAFEVASAYYLGRGPLKLPNRFGAREATVRDGRHRNTRVLFEPAARALWPDPRFAALCRETGLMDYWRVSRTAPDLLGMRPFTV